MRKTTVVEPFTGDFSRTDLLVANRIAKENPREISDVQLQYLAAYDRHHAQEVADKRDRLRRLETVVKDAPATLTEGTCCF